MSFESLVRNPYRAGDNLYVIRTGGYADCCQRLYASTLRPLCSTLRGKFQKKYAMLAGSGGNPIYKNKLDAKV